MAMNFEDSFKEWLMKKLASYPEDDSFVTYIFSMLDDEETGENDKKDSLLAFLQELCPV
jgi:hypothetical protein